MVNQYCAHSFARNWQLPFLNQRKGENDRRKYFMINLRERMLPTSAGVEPATSWSPVGRRIQLSLFICSTVVCEAAYAPYFRLMRYSIFKVTRMGSLSSRSEPFPQPTFRDKRPTRVVSAFIFVRNKWQRDNKDVIKKYTKHTKVVQIYALYYNNC